MNKQTVDILGVRIDVVTIQKLNSLIIERANSGSSNRPFVIFKPYVEFLSIASRNDEIRKLLNQADINAPDSIALQWAASYLYGNPKIHSGIFHAYYSLIFRLQNKSWLAQILPQRMAGLDQTLPLLQEANKRQLKVGVLGGPKDSARTLAEISGRYKKIKWQVWSGYFAENEQEELVEQINQQKLDILFCAMGFPKQEKFIIKYKNSLGAKVIIGEGGSFDYDQMGGKIRRAPKLVRNLGLEWLWRLVRQPARLRRQMAIPSFINRVILQKNRQK